jgi:hypothetical protein
MLIKKHLEAHTMNRKHMKSIHISLLSHEMLQTKQLNIVLVYIRNGSFVTRIIQKQKC